MELTAAEIAAATGGEVVAGRPDARATSFTIDSRILEPGGCFVALVAARNGHAYLPAAWARGATVAVVGRAVDPPPPGAAVIRVDDGLVALGALGATARDRLWAARVVGVTGSAGKTTTKDLTTAAVATRRVHASPASFNNEAGVPLTLLGAPPDTEIVVTEMGARFVGNITALTDIAHPDIGIITHVGLAHAGNLGGVDGVARVKGELVEALPAGGLAILNADCPHAAALGARTDARVVLVGTSPSADVRITELTLDDELRPRFSLSTPWGSTRVRLALHGEHHATNAAMAATAAAELGVPLDVAAAGLAHTTSAALRMELTHTRAGVTIINDAYNSSPTSAAAALQALGRVAASGHRIAVLGEMLELGSYGPEAHAELGRLTRDVGVDLVVAVGPGAAPIAASARDVGVPVVDAADPCAAVTVVTETVRAGDAVLVKASRAVGLEHVAAALQARGDEPT
jgi:UDP-N-acetylmuramoyl-tripeptide--D-alanyl-D-alanine ligase